MMMKHTTRTKRSITSWHAETHTISTQHAIHSCVTPYSPLLYEFSSGNLLRTITSGSNIWPRSHVWLETMFLDILLPPSHVLSVPHHFFLKRENPFFQNRKNTMKTNNYTKYYLEKLMSHYSEEKISIISHTS